MAYVVDANILLRLSQPHHVLHEPALSALANLLTAGETVCLIPQVLYEYWTVATRPETARGGLGFTPLEAEKAVNEFLSDFTLLPDPPGLFEEWRVIVRTLAVSGKDAHDARIVAALQLHSVEKLLTFDIEDFKRYPSITPVHPSDVPAA